MKPRIFIQKIHLWLSIAGGVFISLIGLTGSLLVFEPELNQLLHPQLYKVTEGQPVSYQKALNHVLAAHPNGIVQRVYTPREPSARGVYLFRLQEDGEQQEVFVDPGTGHINGELGSHSFFNFVKEFHEQLLLKDFNGEKIVGIIGFIFFFISLSGLYLWWPGIKKWARGFTMRKSKNQYVRNYDLHKMIGGIFVPFLLVVSLTGALFVFDENIFHLFGAEAKVMPAKEKIMVDPVHNEPTSIDSWISAAQKTVQGGSVMQVRFPAQPKQGTFKEPIEIRVSRPYDPGYGNVKVWVDPYHGKTLAKLDPKINRRMTYQTWHFPLHTGQFGGWLTKILYAIGGCTPSVLMFTGIYMWRYKKNKQKRKLPLVA
ncbi:PepSY-associated TM helix domain-containing protein [Fictibacillus sp. Mic-4]|uniref:PepSY-associated TM helix domain-containing protein n=1 Tax=Fictibacillus TaxID=1329200 RepID=UPI00040E317E|nr:PepSY-associated TM helix domain-containing protein [Fictibacillus gelatini]